jgi:hypothetical protein
VAVTFVIYSFTIRLSRPVLLANAISISFPCCLWIGSIFVSEPRREALIWVAIFFDQFGTEILLVLLEGYLLPSAAKKKIGRLFEYFPGNTMMIFDVVLARKLTWTAINIEHRTERIGAFVTVVFGFSIIELIYQNKNSFGLNGFVETEGYSAR